MLIALHKPFGVLSQFTPEAEGQRTLAEFDLPKKVYPIGRLDRDSEGLLLLTDEKRKVDQILNPRHKIEKRYYAQVEGDPSPEQLKKLRTGVVIRVNKRDHKTAPAEAKLLIDIPEFEDRVPPIRVRKTVHDAWIELVITEGKNRQVRKMCASVGLPVLRLIRRQIDNCKLGELKQGKWRIITP